MLKAQVKAVSIAFHKWNVKDKAQTMYYDTTARKTVLLNETEVVLFASRHHIYDLVLKSVLEIKIQEFSVFFKKLVRKNIDCDNIRMYTKKAFSIGEK